MQLFSLEQIHNKVIHFPIALLSASVLFNLIGFYSDNKKMYSTSWYLLILGTLSALSAVITGFIADKTQGHMSEPFPIFTTHGSTQIFASLLFLSLLIWRYVNIRTETKPTFVYLVASIAGILILFYGGHLGAVIAGRI